MEWFLAISLTIATGFVAGGLIGSFYTLMTNRRVSFHLPEDSWLAQALALIVLIFAGPTVIMRNALAAQILERRAPFWLVLSTALACFWSLMSGIFVLDIFGT